MLLTHIPLSRPDGASCGPLRERGTIRRGKGFGYQNTLDEPVSQLLLETLKPKLILRYVHLLYCSAVVDDVLLLPLLLLLCSGDDHDYCEYDHPLPLPADGCSDSSCSGLPLHAREVTVKSFSMAMGIHKPGFQLLTIRPPPSTSPSHADHTILDRPCTLPDQLALYIWGYLPLLLITLGVLLVLNSHRVIRAAHSPADHVPRSSDSPERGWQPTSNGAISAYPMFTRGREADEDTEAKLEDAYDDEDDLHSYENSLTPNYAPPARHHMHRPSTERPRTFVFRGQRRSLSLALPSLLSTLPRWCCSTTRARAQSPGVWSGFCRDVFDVAWVPLSLFVGIAWWMS